MTGLDIMLSQLQAEAKAEADSRLAAAREEADQLLAQADAEAESGAELIARQAEEEAARHLERTRSSADRKRRMILLQAKQEVIAEVLKKAYEKMDSLEDGAYFDLIRRLLREEKSVFPRETGRDFPPALKRRSGKSPRSGVVPCVWGITRPLTTALSWLTAASKKTAPSGLCLTAGRRPCRMRRARCCFPDS